MHPALRAVPILAGSPISLLGKAKGACSKPVRDRADIKAVFVGVESEDKRA